ncbi:hypothetical protein DAPPUDRAFT_266578 [Daphnia pulex]|uniref:Cuticle protein 6 n=1 Tax=Daphnia pulex TaxID=6669 RepID=E9HV84_DAPPU|nr:hypothetical protein DAPPUDRAFT_266578 [Daphnia pulex]|eukprot:EFX64348.1 hypothetical protein DAPPUDRAFT_266578 [Daphnia pulex]
MFNFIWLEIIAKLRYANYGLLGLSDNTRQKVLILSYDNKCFKDYRSEITRKDERIVFAIVYGHRQPIPGTMVACLLVLVVAVQSQWPNNFAGYGLNPAGFFGGFNGLYPGYAGFPAGQFYGHPGRYVNYPAASLPAYDAFGNQVGGYGQVHDTPEVAQAKAAHFAAHDAARARLFTPVVAARVAAVPVADAAVTPTLAIETAASSLVETVATPVVETVSAPVESVAVVTPIMSRKKRQIQPALGNAPFAFPYGGYYPAAANNNFQHPAVPYITPNAGAVGAAVAPIFPMATSTQYHAQDEFGQTTFGYAHPGQAATNYRDALGNQIGSYSYFNPEGKQVRVSYTADHRGFRVLSNDLPVGPVQVQDTFEVAQAKAAHFAAHAAARARLISTPPAVSSTAVEAPVVAAAEPAVVAIPSADATTAAASVAQTA